MNLKNYIKILIKENLKDQFLIDKLNKLDSKFNFSSDIEYEESREYINEIEKFCGKPIGKGISRLVYQIDDDFVLKFEVAYSYQQNLLESNSSLISIIRKYAPKIFEISKSKPNPTWIVVERCKPLSNNKSDAIMWLNKIGLPDEIINHDLDEYRGSDLYDADSSNDIISAWIFSLAELLNSKSEPRCELEARIFEIENNFKIDINEFGINNLGFGLDGRPVILDLGYSYE